MAFEFLTPVADVPVTLDEMVASNVGKFHVLGVTDRGDTSTVLSEFSGNDTVHLSPFGGKRQLSKPESVRYVTTPSGRVHFIVGLGKDKDWVRGPDDNPKTALLERVRRAVGSAYDLARGFELKGDLTIAPLGWGNVVDNGQLLEAITDAAVRSGWQGTRMFDTDRGNDSPINQIRVLVPEISMETTRSYAHASILAKAENLARFIAEAPPDYMSAHRIVDAINRVISQRGGQLRVVEPVVYRDELVKAENHPFAGLGAVAKGSQEAAFVHAYYNGNPDSQNSIAIVAKGVTFDTGGVQPKPGEAMKDMTGDKAGAGVALGLMDALAAMKVPINAHFYFGLTANLNGREAVLPETSLYMGNDAKGKPFEPGFIGNTDAEGRLVMSTGVALAGKDPNVRAIITLATLTGAMLVGGGKRFCGIVGNAYNDLTQSIIKAIMEAGELSYERFMHFPTDEGYAKALRKGTPFGAIQNIGPDRWGGVHYGYYYLDAFTSGKPLVHCDIASMLLHDSDKAYLNGGRFGAPPVMALGGALETIARTMRSE